MATSSLPEVPLDRFLRYDELVELLHGLAAARPELMTLDELGRSHEGRGIWLATLTNQATGPHHEKPALWVEANIHSVEVTGSVAALHLIHTLLSTYGGDGREAERVTRALDTRTFYVLPRLNPDGAELALSDAPRFLRSSVRPWPRADVRVDGYVESDVDGDGRILSMRIPDPNGTWKADAEDPRLLVARSADDGPADGPYWRLLPEGLVEDYDGDLVPRAKKVENLDLNRNWPMEWRPPGEQRGAGDYSTSEPEVRAAVAGMIARPNLCGYIAYHTFSGVHLRPYSAHADDTLPTADLRMYKAIGKGLTDITSYRNISVYHDFKYDLKQTEGGASDDWAYDHLGLFAWTTELWNPQKAAGIEDTFHFIEWFNEHPIEDDRKLLSWADAEIPGRGYVDWYAFDHPQLGPVELGGWDSFHTWTNPPAHLIAAEVAPQTRAAVWHCLISPRLELRRFVAEPAQPGELADTLAQDVWRVRVVLENSGWLPTQVSQKALDRKAVRGIEVTLTLPDGATLAAGKALQELGQLAGRALKTNMIGAGEDPTDDRTKAEWVVIAPIGTELAVEASHPRAGVVRGSLVLGASPT